MARVKTMFVCRSCGATSPTWVGRCSGCEEWNTLEELIDPASSGPSHAPALMGPDRPVPVNEVDAEAWSPHATGIDELDRVLAGGLVPGSVTLLGGEPGIGKSTLLLQAAGRLATSGLRVLYVSAEESKPQVRLRAERLRTMSPSLWLAADTTLDHVVSHLDEVRPEIMVVDSVQTLHDPRISSAPGSVTQVRECAHRLVFEAKRRNVAVVLVGHVTKEGALAGPRVLEHLVDTVLAFEGERTSALRLLRAVKHRFGSTNELGLFEMEEHGLVGVPDASGLLLADRLPGVSGSVVAPTLEGVRPVLIEIQALAATSALPAPRRSAQGLDGGRLAMILAVLEKRAGIRVGRSDVHALAVGGVQVREPGADLALALAVSSSMVERPVPESLVACGEIGLGGEVRSVAHLPKRLAEAARLGFTRALVPRSAPAGPSGLTLVRVATVAEALEMGFDTDPQSKSFRRIA